MSSPRIVPIRSLAATPSDGALTHAADAEPAQAAELAPALTRRRALQLMAASAALASGACTRAPRQRIYPYVDMPEAGTAGVPIYYASSFVRDGHAHGVLIGTREGRPIKIEGNPSHPSSRGATDVYAQASVLQLWDPDRAQSVWQRLPSETSASVGASATASRVQPLLAASAPSSWAAFEAAWRARMPHLRADGGARLRVLTRGFTSPTLHAQLADLLQRWPNARWHRHSPLEESALREGARRAFGRALQPLRHFDRARFVVALDTDPFSHGPGSVRAAHDWAAQRAAARVVGGTAAPMRTMAVETTPGLFGARADARLALAPEPLEALIRRVAAKLYDDLPAPAPAKTPNDAVARFERDLVEGLRRHRGDSLLVAGASLSAGTHALVLLLNQRLGALGRTLDLIAPLDGEGAGTLFELTQEMQAGAIDTLLILGGNPAYDAPADVPFAAALEQVPFSASLGLYRDETARRCTWQLPASHVYEQWSDALAHDGSASLIQPAIAPLYDTRSAHELLALLAADTEHDGHALLRRHWQASALMAGDFETRWRESLRRGVVAGSASAPLQLGAAHRSEALDLAAPAAPGASARSSASATVPTPAAPPAPPASHPSLADALVAFFVADPSVGDGSYANNGWLQELPRPFTKLTWDNAIRLGPVTAAALHLARGDIVRASIGARNVEAPVWVQAGHAEGAATLPLGYGRRHAGSVGDGIGFDAYALRPQQGGAPALQLTPTGRTHDFAVTQHEADQHDRELARSVVPGAPIEHPDTAHATLYPAVDYPQHAWGMAIDLDACIGCNACTIACQAENNIPVVGAEEVARGRQMHWIRVDRYDDAEAGSLFQPVPCMHCENAPCEVVCPVGATVHDSEGLNVQVYNRCIGTRFCSNNCPYKVRRFNFLQYADTETESLKAQRNPDVTVRQRGVMEKCTYCLQRITRARLNGERSGKALVDGDVVTACQSACPTRAIHFGDLNDPNADVVRAKASPRHYALLGELNTRPRTTYLARVVVPKAGST